MKTIMDKIVITMESVGEHIEILFKIIKNEEVVRNKKRHWKSEYSDICLDFNYILILIKLIIFWSGLKFITSNSY